MEIQYGPDKLCTLDPGSSRHLSWADGVWFIARTLADDALHIARMLADGACHVARMLVNGVLHIVRTLASNA